MAAISDLMTDRGGSHNLVIGRFNRSTQTAFGGLVAGEVSTISNVSASVTGGDQNAATRAHAAASSSWQLIWHDEFEGAPGSKPDERWWTPERACDADNPSASPNAVMFACTFRNTIHARSHVVFAEFIFTYGPERHEDGR